MVPTKRLDPAWHQRILILRPPVVSTSNDQSPIWHAKAGVVPAIRVNTLFLVGCPYHQASVSGVSQKFNICLHRVVPPVRRTRHELRTAVVRIVAGSPSSDTPGTVISFPLRRSSHRKRIVVRQAGPQCLAKSDTQYNEAAENSAREDNPSTDPSDTHHGIGLQSWMRMGTNSGANIFSSVISTGLTFMTCDGFSPRILAMTIFIPSSPISYVFSATMESILPRLK